MKPNKRIHICMYVRIKGKKQKQEQNKNNNKIKKQNKTKGKELILKKDVELPSSSKIPKNKSLFIL